LRLHVYIREASHVWMIVGTIIVIFSMPSKFELSFAYILTIFIVWGLIVGLPFFILTQVWRWLERRSQRSASTL